MKKLVLSLTVALMLGFGATAVVAAEPARGPSGFAATSDSANSKGKTGPIVLRPSAAFYVARTIAVPRNGKSPSSRQKITMLHFHLKEIVA